MTILRESEKGAQLYDAYPTWGEQEKAADHKRRYRQEAAADETHAATPAGRLEFVNRELSRLIAERDALIAKAEAKEEEEEAADDDATPF